MFAFSTTPRACLKYHTHTNQQEARPLRSCLKGSTFNVNLCDKSVNFDDGAKSYVYKRSRQETKWVPEWMPKTRRASNGSATCTKPTAAAATARREQSARARARRAAVHTAYARHARHATENGAGPVTNQVGTRHTYAYRRRSAASRSSRCDHHSSQRSLRM